MAVCKIAKNNPQLYDRLLPTLRSLAPFLEQGTEKGNSSRWLVDDERLWLANAVQEVAIGCECPKAGFARDCEFEHFQILTCGEWPVSGLRLRHRDGRVKVRQWPSSGGA